MVSYCEGHDHFLFHPQFTYMIISYIHSHLCKKSKTIRGSPCSFRSKRSVFRSFQVRRYRLHRYQQIMNVKWRTLDEVDVLISTQIGIFCIFLELRSFFPVELVPQTHTLAFVEKYDSIFVEIAIKTSHVQKFFF